jgi:hypothetical protein
MKTLQLGKQWLQRDIIQAGNLTCDWSRKDVAAF